MGHEQAKPKRGAPGRTLRIIAGRWRGRRWQFPPGEIRPTGDRVRETLFNWLQGRLAGRRCLDLYAGSGALGLEALSRGAAHCVFVDRDVQVTRNLAQVLTEWQVPAEDFRLEVGDAAQYLARAAQPNDRTAHGDNHSGHAVDLVFLDPPFAAGTIAETVAMLEHHGWLVAGALIYLEHRRTALLPVPPSAWKLLRSGTAGAVGYDLYERS